MKHLALLVCLTLPWFVQAKELQIGAGDEIQVFVTGNPELSISTQVLLDGSITMPLLGRVDLQEKSPEQAGWLLKSLLVEGGFLRKPQVTVSILNSVKNKVSILGKVTKPGQYKIGPSIENILDLVSVAGGVGPENEVVIVRRYDEGLKRIVLNVEQLILSSDMNSYIDEKYQLLAGDVIYVKSEPVFYTFGEVGVNSVFPLKEGLILRQAISIAGGLSKIADDDIKIMRLTVNGKYSIIDADMESLIHENDVILVEESLF